MTYLSFGIYCRLALLALLDKEFLDGVQGTELLK